MPTYKICPCCNQMVEQRTSEEVNRAFDAMKLFYDLEGGTVWAPNRVGFNNKTSAYAFKSAYPEYTVFWTCRRTPADTVTINTI